MAETPNLEARSNTALLCLVIGFALMGLAWALGFGGIAALALSGDAPAAMAGGVAATIMVPLAGLAGMAFAGVGIIWIIVRVIVDQSRGDRYSKNIHR
ncbi:MAG: hypothetical protein ACOYM8_11945 [Caulobacterales bacterium]